MSDFHRRQSRQDEAGRGELLSAHLLKPFGQQVRVVASRGLTPGLSLGESLADLRRLSAASQTAAIGFQHITVNPAKSWTGPQTTEAVRRILSELGAEFACLDAGRACRKGPRRRGHRHPLSSDRRPCRTRRACASYVAKFCTVGSRGENAGAGLRRSNHPVPATGCGRTLSEANEPGRRHCICGCRVGPGGATAQRDVVGQSSARGAGRGLDLPAARAAVRAAWGSANLVSALRRRAYGWAGEIVDRSRS